MPRLGPDEGRHPRHQQQADDSDGENDFGRDEEATPYGGVEGVGG